MVLLWRYNDTALIRNAVSCDPISAVVCIAVVIVIVVFHRWHR